MWVTRDKNDALRLWSHKPERKGDCWVFPFMSDFSFKLDFHLFPNLKWEDEALEVSIVSNEFISEVNKLTDNICGEKLGRPKECVEADVLFSMKKVNELLNETKGCC